MPLRLPNTASPKQLADQQAVGVIRRPARAIARLTSLFSMGTVVMRPRHRCNVLFGILDHPVKMGTLVKAADTMYLANGDFGDPAVRMSYASVEEELSVNSVGFALLDSSRHSRRRTSLL